MVTKDISEEYVKPQTAKLLKDAGFHEMTMDYYYNGEFNKDIDTMIDLWDDWNAHTDIDIMSAPSQSLAMRWLRDVHQMPCDIVAVPKNGMTVDKNGTGHPKDGWKYVVVHTALPTFLTYEDAAEAAIGLMCEIIIREQNSKE